MKATFFEVVKFVNEIHRRGSAFVPFLMADEIKKVAYSLGLDVCAGLYDPEENKIVLYR